MSIKIGYIENVSGNASVIAANGDASQAAQNMQISGDAIVKTAEGAHVVIRFNDGSSMTVGPNQSVLIDKSVHDSAELPEDETTAEVNSLKAILAEDPDLSVFEETAAGETVAIGGSSVTVDSILHHNDNRGDAASTALGNLGSDKIIPPEEEENLFGVFPDDRPVIITLNNILTNDNTPTISGTVNDTEAVIVISVGGNDYTADNNGDGTWTLPATDPMPDGETVITVVGTDPVGNTTTETALITVDTIGPTLTVDPVNTNETTPLITGTTDDETAAIIVTVGGSDYTATNNGDGTWTVPTTGTLPEGDTDITVVATDPAGNTTTETAVITVDITAPTVTINDLVTNDTTPAITGTTDDNSATIVVTVGATDYTATNNGDNTWTLADDTITALTLGENTILVTATDPAGNEATATTTTGSITIDTTAPTVTINDLVTNDTTPAISGTTDDPVAEIVVTVGGSDYTATNNGDGTWTLVDGAVGVLPQGPTTVTVTATDTAGNTTAVTDNIVVDSFLIDDDNDNGGKVVTIDSVTDDNGEFNNDFVTNDTTLIIRGTYDNEVNNALVVTVDGVVASVVITDKQWEVNLEGTPFADGTHTIAATVTDTAGNVVTVSKDIVIDTSSTDDNGTGTGIGGADATVTLDEISGNYINLDESQQGVTVTGTTTLVAGNEVTVELNGKSYTTTSTGSDLVGTDNTFTLTIPTADLTLLADGTYIVTATVVADNAGNTVSDTEDVIVDTTAGDNNSTGTGIGGADATVVLDEISGNYINLEETQQGITVTGTTTLLSGNDITVELNGKSYTTASTGSDLVGADNTFTLTIPTEDLSVLADDTYIVTATVIADNAGNTVSDTEDVTVDTSNSDNNGNGNTTLGADATITLHEISDNYINAAETGQNLLITGTSTATPGSAVTIEVTGADGVAHNINEFLDPDPVIEVNAFGNFSVTFIASAFSGFPDGDYTVTATVSADNAGNPVSDTKNVTLDTTFTDADGDFPQGGGNLITIDSITDDTGIDSSDFITSDNKLIISGSFDNETTNRILSVTVDGVAYNVVTSTDMTNKNWSVDLQNVTLIDGDHTVVATISDEAGNTQSATQVITIDTTPAAADAIVLDEISNNYINGLEHDQPLTISGSVGTASNEGDSVSIDFNGITYNTTVVSGRFSVDLPVSDVQALVDGSVYTATATTSTATLTVSDTEDVTVDLTLSNTGANNGNLITIDGITEDTGISNSDFITNDTRIVISGTYDNSADINGIENVLTVTINGNLYTPTIADPINNPTAWTIDLTNTPLSDGDYVLIATVTDAAGNATSQTQTITIDATVNPIEGDATILLDPISDNYINLTETTSNTLVAITGSTTAANGAVVSIYVNGNLFDTTLAQDGLFALDITKDTFTVYPDGSYAVTAEVAADAAGNIASDLQTVLLDTSVTDTTGGNGINGVDATVTLDAITHDINYTQTQEGIIVAGTTTLVAGNEVLVEINGETYLTTATGANSTSTPNTFSVTIPPADLAVLPVGTYTVTATIVADKAGNTVIDTENVIVDTDPTTNLTFMVDTSSSMNDIVNVTNEYTDTIFSFFFFGATRDISVAGNPGDTISLYNNGEIGYLGTIDDTGIFEATIDLASYFFFFTIGSYTIKVGESRLDLTKDAINNTIDEYALNGDVNVQLYDMNNPTIVIDSTDLTAVKTEIDALTAQGGTDYDLATATVSQDTTLTPAMDNQIYFISDGGDTLNDETTWQTYIESIDASVNAIGIGDTVTLQELDEVSSPNGSDITNTPTIVTDENQLLDTLSNTISDDNDVLLYDTNVLQNDGRIGIDTLVLNSADDLDFSTVSNIQNIEGIDLVGADHTVTNLGAQDVIDMTDAGNELFIYGDAGDNVALDTTLIDQSSTVADSNGTLFDVYSDAGSTVTVNIEQEIIVS